ncbi:MAG: hypothetical protein AAF598_15500 [Bacteroidota bacterium]
MKSIEIQDHHLDWIEQFLLDRLNDQELQHFHQMLADHPALQQELETQQEIFEGLKALGPTWEEETAKEAKNKHSLTASMFKRNRYIIALFFMGVLSLTIFDQFQLPSNPVAQPVQSLNVETNEVLPLMHNGDLGYEGLYWMIQNNIHINWRSNHPYESFHAQRV